MNPYTFESFFPALPSRIRVKGAKVWYFQLLWFSPNKMYLFFTKSLWLTWLLKIFSVAVTCTVVEYSKFHFWIPQGFQIPQVCDWGPLPQLFASAQAGKSICLSLGAHRTDGNESKAVLWIYDILVRIRIWTCGSMPSGFGSGSQNHREKLILWGRNWVHWQDNFLKEDYILFFYFLTIKTF